MKSLLIILLSSMFLSCNADTQNQNDTSLNTEQRVELLKSTYRKVSSAQGDIYEQEYFNVFPNSFDLLNSLFGYSNKKSSGKDFNPAPLYDESHLYINAFYNLNTIDKAIFFKCIINICIDGKWYADGVNYFQHGMQNKVKNNLTDFCNLLSDRNDKDIKSFWHFYFDGPITVKKIPKELQEIEQINNRIYISMEEVLKEMQ